tara:strand:- start:1577 stop:2488 length:912 start_codon:yes stop_codon:yes gene_type:complete
MMGILFIIGFLKILNDSVQKKKLENTISKIENSRKKMEKEIVRIEKEYIVSKEKLEKANYDLEKNILLIKKVKLLELRELGLQNTKLNEELKIKKSNIISLNNEIDILQKEIIKWKRTGKFYNFVYNYFNFILIFFLISVSIYFYFVIRQKQILKTISEEKKNWQEGFKKAKQNSQQKIRNSQEEIIKKEIDIDKKREQTENLLSHANKKKQQAQLYLPTFKTIINNLKLKIAKLTEEINRKKGYYKLSTSSENQENKKMSYKDFDWNDPYIGGTGGVDNKREEFKMEVQNPYGFETFESKNG